MQGILLLVSLCLFCSRAIGQAIAFDPSSITPEQGLYWKEWADNLYEIGVDVKADRVAISDEARRAGIDSNYRKIIYPATYSWERSMYIMKKMQMKIGFWHLINLYAASPSDKHRVVKFILSFDEIMDMEKVLVSAFYTYGFFDPESGSIENGKLNVKRPDLVEKKLGVVKELCDSVLAFRSQKKEDAKKK